jgi:hypothetical protein
MHIRLVLAISLALIVPGAAFAGGNKPNAIPGIVATLKTHQIVAIGESHQDVVQHRWFEQLIRNRDVQSVVNDIVVEFANPIHQDILDRYIAGQDVPHQELAKVWQDSVMIMVWDSPVYESLLRTVREANQKLPADHRLRVLACDAPIDWTKVHNAKEYEQFAERDSDCARILQHEVFARNRRALMFYGAAHLVKQDPVASVRTKPARPSLPELLRTTAGVRMYSVFAVNGPKYKHFSKWQPGTFKALPGTALGKKSLAVLSPGEVTILRKVGGKSEPYTVKPTDFPPLENVWDAVVYLGSKADKADPPKGTYAYDAYYNELLRRAQIMTDLFGVDMVSDVKALRPQ